MEAFGCFLFQRETEPRTFDVTGQRRINQGKSDADCNRNCGNQAADY